MPMIATQPQEVLANQKNIKPGELVFVGGIAAIAALLFIFFLAWGWLKHYLKKLSRSGSPPGSPEPPQVIVNGVDPAVLEVFPIIVFSYHDDDNKIDDPECAVCLNFFKDNEVLRLLPSCMHGFHLHCIELWLQSHSTCPLCRRNVVVMKDELARTHTFLRDHTSEPSVVARQSLELPELCDKDKAVLVSASSSK
ncbi:hypothetical protein O6H91_06G095200 [Diphasiastrum complanatum]|uniref:Uncharacterized protein n=2 Tax=Diphasiastrum complanatum TaxID=34168 RepID=A0ACC2DGD6_DIPCM|nr:hypothetical protein O6H91_06G094800 [Diphasiastrum complanatum]KAJ7553361.1 hypothetical protein O6H91_06G095200 [Diphasiastrum complanatum]